MPLSVLLLGASTRAMAYSALRAGWQPLCLDLFADRDLQAVAEVEAVPLADYPAGLLERASRYPTSIPALYTGGLENHPSVYLELAKQRPVWGYLHPDPMHGKSVRNVEYLDTVCRAQGIARPAHGAPQPGWLVKPRAGAGGRGIRLWHGEALDASHFAEEHLAAPSYAALYVRSGLQVQLLGITQQLTPLLAHRADSPLQPPTPFTYSGSMGPVFLEQDQVKQLDRLGKALVNADGYLQGIFGVDFVLHNEEVYVLEVNPRYTASVELLELSQGYSQLALHGMAFGQERASQDQTCSEKIMGKAILYASASVAFPENGPWTNLISNPWELPEYADIPAPGTRFYTGEPMLTLYAEGADEQQVFHRLLEKSIALRECWSSAFRR